MTVPYQYTVLCHYLMTLASLSNVWVYFRALDGHNNFLEIHNTQHDVWDRSTMKTGSNAHTRKHKSKDKDTHLFICFCVQSTAWATWSMCVGHRPCVKQRASTTWMPEWPR